MSVTIWKTINEKNQKKTDYNMPEFCLQQQTIQSSHNIWRFIHNKKVRGKKFTVALVGCVKCAWLRDILVKTETHIILLLPHIISWLPSIYQQTKQKATQINSFKRNIHFLHVKKGNIQFKDHQKQSLMIAHILVQYSVP